MIRAITFDLWDTIIHDDSDEPKRAEMGLRTKQEERCHLLWQTLDGVETISQETVWLAYDMADAAFKRVWHEQFITWTVRHRLQLVLDCRSSISTWHVASVGTVR